MSTEKYLGFIVCLGIAGVLATWAVNFGTAMRDEIQCKKARQAYFDAGFHAALTRDPVLIRKLDDYRDAYKAVCHE